MADKLNISFSVWKNQRPNDIFYTTVINKYLSFLKLRCGNKITMYISEKSKKLQLEQCLFKLEQIHNLQMAMIKMAVIQY